MPFLVQGVFIMKMELTVEQTEQEIKRMLWNLHFPIDKEARASQVRGLIILAKLLDPRLETEPEVWRKVLDWMLTYDFKVASIAIHSRQQFKLELVAMIKMLFNTVIVFQRTDLTQFGHFRTTREQIIDELRDILEYIKVEMKEVAWLKIDSGTES